MQEPYVIKLASSGLAEIILGKGGITGRRIKENRTPVNILTWFRFNKPRVSSLAV
ncbi:MAG: hypothetical protein QXW09_05065 [Thermoproteota archaeon]